MLKHVNGSLTCHKKFPGLKSLWGCSDPPNIKEDIMTVITDVDNKIVFPAFPKPDFNGWKGFTVPGVNAKTSQVLVYMNLASPKFFIKGQQLRIWYSEDLVNQWTEDNEGDHCVEAYAKF